MPLVRVRASDSLHGAPPARGNPIAAPLVVSRTSSRIADGAYGSVFPRPTTRPGLIAWVALKIPRAQAKLLTPEDRERFFPRGALLPLPLYRTQASPASSPSTMWASTRASPISSATSSMRSITRRPAQRPARSAPQASAESAEIVAQVAEAAPRGPPARCDPSRRQAIEHLDRPLHRAAATDGLRPGQARGRGGNHSGDRPDPGGTPAYMESGAGIRAVSSRKSMPAPMSIVWASYFLSSACCGELPFRGTRRRMLDQIQYDDPKPLRTLNDRIPRDLETITLKAIAKEPGRRSASASDLSSDVRRYMKGQPILARAVGRIEKSWRWALRYPAIAALAGFAAFHCIFLRGRFCSRGGKRGPTRRARGTGCRAEGSRKI